MTVAHVMIILMGLPVLFIAIDVALAVDKREGNTYSEIIRSAGRRWLPLAIVFGFCFGLLCGHLFWSPVITEPCPKEAPR